MIDANDMLVSCIIPVFNGERFLAEAIKSILQQTYRPLEVVVVDDGSTDGTATILRGFGARITLVTQDQAGPAVARNRGIAEARGTYIAFLDADDLWAPQKIERQMQRLADEDEPGFCLCHAQNFWEDEMEQERRQFADHPRSRPMPGYVTQALLAHREVFDRIGAFNAAMEHGDAADWFLRAREAGIAGPVLQDVLVYRRLHCSNLSRRQAPDSREEFLRLVKASLDRNRGKAS